MNSDVLPPAESFAALVWKRFRKHRLACFSLYFIIALIFISFPGYTIITYFTGFKYEMIFTHVITLDDDTKLYGDFKEEADYDSKYSEFTPKRHGNFIRVYKIDLKTPEPAKPKEVRHWEKENGDIIVGTVSSIRSNYYILQTDYILFPKDRVLEHKRSKYLPPSSGNFFGTNKVGQDVFTQIIFGGRISLSVGIISSLLASLLGVIIGSIAGYYGKWIDSLLMRFTDAMLAIPILPFMIVLSSVDLAKVPGLRWVIENWGESAVSILKINMVIVFFSWMTVARLVRGSILSLKETQFIEAAHALGLSAPRIIGLHLIPNCMAPVIVATTLAVGNNIVYESVLSFLGLGIQPPMPSWGNMLDGAMDYLKDSFSLFFIPGFFISLTVFAFNFLGDGLRDALDPRYVSEG